MVRCPEDPEIENNVFRLFQKHSASLAELGLVDHFRHASTLKEQLFRSLTVACSTAGLGKKKFRGLVELYLEPAFRNTRNPSRNCGIAAQDFIDGLGKVFGETISRAIVENYDSKYLAEYDTIK